METATKKVSELSCEAGGEPGRRERAGEPLGVALGTFFGVGYFPMGPGTLASALTVGLCLWLGPAGASPLWLLAAPALLIAPAAWAAGACERRFGSCDPRQVVLDEVLGQMIALAAVPRGLTVGAGWKYSLLGFILFRFFDIVKPFPVRRLERFPRGWGVMADDYGAGVYAFAALQIAVWLGS